MLLLFHLPRLLLYPATSSLLFPILFVTHTTVGDIRFLEPFHFQVPLQLEPSVQQMARTNSQVSPLLLQRKNIPRRGRTSG